MKRKPNNYDVALRQTEKFKGVQVPVEIEKHEEHLYHVLIIKSRPNAKTLEFENNAKVQTFHKEVFGKNAENGFQRLGYDNLVIFHDPTIKEAKAVKEEK